MTRGIDCELFHPSRRTAPRNPLRLGYVGRVTPEKRVRFLVDIEHALLSAGHRDFQMVVVGEGDERPWLERNLHQGVFTGVLRDHALAEAYANMDLFIFPSRTDTFGNVIQEAAASGVPAVVTAEGGPMHLVVKWSYRIYRAGRSRIRSNSLGMRQQSRKAPYYGPGRARKSSRPFMGFRFRDDLFRLPLLPGVAFLAPRSVTLVAC
jgi:Glycosyl transferases group 1